MHDPLGNDHVLGECSGAMVIRNRDSQHLPPIAQVHIAAPAVVTLSAIDSGIERNVVAVFEGSVLSTDSCHGSSRLVPHDDRRNATSRGAVVTVHIAPADAARLDP